MVRRSASRSHAAETGVAVDSGLLYPCRCRYWHTSEVKRVDVRAGLTKKRARDLRSDMSSLTVCSEDGAADITQLRHETQGHRGHNSVGTQMMLIRVTPMGNCHTVVRVRASSSA